MRFPPDVTGTAPSNTWTVTHHRSPECHPQKVTTLVLVRSKKKKRIGVSNLFRVVWEIILDPPLFCRTFYLVLFIIGPRGKNNYLIRYMMKALTKNGCFAEADPIYQKGLDPTYNFTF